MPNGYGYPGCGYPAYPVNQGCGCNSGNGLWIIIIIFVIFFLFWGSGSCRGREVC